MISPYHTLSPAGIYESIRPLVLRECVFSHGSALIVVETTIETGAVRYLVQTSGVADPEVAESLEAACEAAARIANASLGVPLRYCPPAATAAYRRRLPVNHKIRAAAFAAIILAAPGLVAAAGAPQTSTPPMGRACQCGGEPNNTSDIDRANPEARDAARHVEGYNAQIRAIDRDTARIKRDRDLAIRPVTRSTLLQANREERARLTRLRDRAAARLNSATASGSSTHGTSFGGRNNSGR